MNLAANLDFDENRIARYNAAVYTTCRALGGSATIVHISLGGLAGAYLLAADKSLANAANYRL